MNEPVDSEQAVLARQLLEQIAPTGKLGMTTARELGFKPEHMIAAGWKLAQTAGGAHWERGS